MAKVSVVIPVYNIAPHLRQCLDSVLGQTLKEIEVICVDDGSTDDSPAILRDYAAKDGRLRVITQTNAGPGVARNAGMEQASGEYLIFLDSDDWFEPNFLENMLYTAERYKADVTICKTVEFDTATEEELPSDWMLKTRYVPGESFVPAQAAEHLFQFTYGWPWDKLYRMDFVRLHGLHYPALRNSEDLVFVFPSLALAQKIAILDHVHVHHRVRRMTSVSNSRHLDPEMPYEALSLFRDGLKENNLYALYEQSFLNWAMEFLVWNVANMGSKEAQKVYFQKLKKVWLPEMEFDRYPMSYFWDKFGYAKYLLVKYAPFWLFSSTVRCYKAMKRLREGG